jgi:S-adenosylmethionine/arginine decarboxylase-like enzyme
MPFINHLETNIIIDYNPMSWGYHLILDSAKCMRSAIRSPIIIAAFSDELVKRIDMVPYGRPQIQHFGSGNKAGYTLVQLIETSNIVAHFVEETDDMYLDVFSCKDYNPDIVKQVVKKYFYPLELQSKFLVRQAGIPPCLR